MTFQCTEIRASFQKVTACGLVLNTDFQENGTHPWNTSETSGLGCSEDTNVLEAGKEIEENVICSPGFMGLPWASASSQLWETMG